MATVPVPRTWTAGETVTATIMNATTGVKGALDFLLSPPRVYAYQTSTTSMVTSGTDQLILFDTELFDTDTMHSTSSNTGRITATTTGLYHVTAQVAFAANATGVRSVQIRLNSAGSSSGGSALAFVRSGNPGNVVSTIPIALDVPLTAGDYMEMFANQNSGGSLSTTAGRGYTFFAARWVANS